MVNYDIAQVHGGSDLGGILCRCDERLGSDNGIAIAIGEFRTSWSWQDRPVRPAALCLPPLCQLLVGPTRPGYGLAGIVFGVIGCDDGGGFGGDPPG